MDITPKKTISVIGYLAAFFLLGSLLTLPAAQPVDAGIYNAEEEVVYKEIWINHNQFPGGMTWDPEERTCTPSSVWGTWYAEPLGLWNCPIYMNFTINAADLENATKAEIYIDLWRNRDEPSLRFTMNNGPVHAPDVGFDSSRTPYVGDFPLSELKSGTNVLKMWKEYQQFHVHDIAIRLYYDAATYPAPTAGLTQITADNGTKAASAGGDLVVDSDQLTLTASVSPAAQYVEFHAYYYGYDEDNDGDFHDWHNLGRQNWHPGGRPKPDEQPPLPDSGTINHIGTVPVNGRSSVSITWNLPHIQGQSDVRFKVRVLDSERRVRDAAGGVSATFNLVRTRPVISFLNPDFDDMALGILGSWPPFEDFTIVQIPVDPADFDKAYLIGAYWRNPIIRINGSANMKPFVGGAEEWALSVREFPISYLQQGANRIDYAYADGSGHMVERPGPMIVLKRTTGAPADGTPPVVYAQLPTPNQTAVPRSAPLSLALADSGVGVDKSTLKLTVAGKQVTPQVAGDRYQYRVSYIPPLEFAPGQTVNVKIEACDFNQNCTVEDYTFEVTAVLGPDEHLLDVDVQSIDHLGAVLGTGAGGAAALTPDKPVYYSGDEVTMQATAAPGWRFTRWERNGAPFGVNPAATITVQQSETITAVFTQEKYGMSNSVLGDLGGTIEVIDFPAGRDYLIYGDKVTLAAVPTPDTNWRFYSWGGDAAANAPNPVTLTVTGNLSVTAVFVEQFDVFLPLINHSP